MVTTKFKKEPNAINRFLIHLDGNNLQEFVLKVAKFYSNIEKPNISEIEKQHFNFKGEIYTKVFDWNETVGQDVIFESENSVRTSEFKITTKYDFLSIFQDGDYLMKIDAFEYVSLSAEDVLPYLPSDYVVGESVMLMPAFVYGGQVTFSPSENQRYGLDDPAEGKEKPREYFKLDKSRNPVAWKSIEAGSPDYVQMNAEGDLDPDSLRYIRDSGMPVPASPSGGDKTARSLLLTGGMDGDREMLSVARATQPEGNDTSETLTEVGALGLASYSRTDLHVKLVNVNQAPLFPDNSVGIQRYLNEVYAPAVVNWLVTIGQALEVPGLKAEDFETGSKGMLSRYTPGMRQVKRAYKRQYGIAKNTLKRVDKVNYQQLTGQKHVFMFECVLLVKRGVGPSVFRAGG